MDESISAPKSPIPVMPDGLLKIIDIFPEALVVVLGTGAIIGTNGAARELFRTNGSSGTYFSNIVSDPPEKISRALTLWTSSRQFLPVSFTLRAVDALSIIRCDGATIRPASDDSPSLLLLRCVPRNEASTTKLFVKLNQEIDSLWKHMAEQKARDSERLNDLATTAALFAHEIANPLNAISMSLQYLELELRDKQDVEATVRDSIADATIELDRLSSLLRDFRSFARPQFFTLQPTDLIKIIRAVLDLQALSFRTAGVSVNFECEPLPPVMADGLKLKQAILNLVKNAIEAMPHGGSLTVKVYLLEVENTIVLEISDTGVGVPEDIDAFALFKTTKRDGTGLGLPIVSQIISAHHGTVMYVSKPDQGTTFKIVLPAVSP